MRDEQTSEPECRGAHASRRGGGVRDKWRLVRGRAVLATASRRRELPLASELNAARCFPPGAAGSSFRRDAKTNTRDACAPRKRAAALFLLTALLSVHAFAGAGATPERKQKELEEAVAKAADSPNADLTKLQCGNLVYAGNKSSICFADKFLSDVAKETNLNVGKNFIPVKLDADNVFDFPFCVWSGEEDFQLTKKERENLRKYVLNGGFILSSPGCSDPKWDTALRRELKLIFPDLKLVKLPMSHPVFSTVNRITRLTDKKGAQTYIEGMEVNGRLALVYTKDGLNDVANAKGCCCCGGNMIVEAVLVNVNVFTYALLY